MPDAPTFDAHVAYKARQTPRAIALATPAGVTRRYGLTVAPPASDTRVQP